ncbi:type 1 glutamine amidotransferase [Marinococcus halophilus]|uniref:Protease n=1 Tax=Marinococcus halophilus TaxID=1371 RepID=A0A510Y5T4_MARHA|nr:type 1 glutamine amidotransferase domain-containing protein [Marinococcus halophilus]OZT80805.1 type 1 glutamine amidotransferase [Marinococcus halophilus]GEK57857.1 protease [Marinococcus halophilus]
MTLQGKRIIAFVEDDFEDLELWVPVMRLREEGAEVLLTGKENGKTYTGKHGVPAAAEAALADVDPADYDGVLVPGGWAPDKLRRYSEVLSIVRYMNDHKKIIGEICHAGWVLASAGILKGVHVTSTPGIKDDMTNAGAVWSDDPVVVDGHIVSSQRPPDIPAYNQALVEAFRAQ